MAEGSPAAAAAIERERLEMKAQLGKIERLAIALTSVLILCSIAYSGGVALSRCSLSDFLRVGLLFVALIFSCEIVGGLLGFLFGIPKLGSAAPVDATAAAKPSDASARGFFKGNTNLEEISDWLTKIIVGVGLVEATQIYGGLGDLAWKFQNTVLPGDASPALSLQAAFLIFGLAALVLGFMFANLETRTRITMLLEDTETLRVGPLSADVKASMEAPIAEVDLTGTAEQQTAVTARPLPSDDALLKMSYQDLQTPDQYAGWGAAQARAGNFVAAARALNDAITRDPDNVDYLLKLAEVRQGQGDERGALVLLNEARRKPKGSDPELLKRVLLNALYLNPPDGFTTAIEVLDQLLKLPGFADNPSVQLWAASAYGQKHRWLKQNQGTDAEIKEARDKALAAVSRVVELSPKIDSAPRVFLRRVFDPAGEKSPPNENDLEIFKDDKDFKEAIYKPEAV